MYKEEEIVRYLKQGDERCMRMIFEGYYQPLCVYALKFILSFEDAEDIVQDILIAFWENKRKAAFIGSVRAYLFGAVQKACLNQLKISGRRSLENIGAYSDRLMAEIEHLNDEESVIRRNQLKKEVDKLPEKCREIFMAIVLENLQYKEVAEKLNISVNTVKTQYARALKQLRGNLDQEAWILLVMIAGRSKSVHPGFIASLEYRCITKEQIP